MADIPVKPRRTGTPWWLWAVLAVVLIALVWFALELFRGDEAAPTPPADVSAAEVPDAAPLALSSLPFSPTR